MYESRIKSRELDALFEAILSLKNIEQCYMLFEDLCTISELNAMALRFQVAQKLNEKRTCQDIAKETGASTATISRVNRCLGYGTGGYRLVLDKNGEDK